MPQQGFGQRRQLAVVLRVQRPVSVSPQVALLARHKGEQFRGGTARGRQVEFAQRAAVVAPMPLAHGLLELGLLSKLSAQVLLDEGVEAVAAICLSEKRLVREGPELRFTGTRNGLRRLHIEAALEYRERRE